VRVFSVGHPLRVSFPWVSADDQIGECLLVWEDERLLERHVAMGLDMSVEIRLEMQVQFRAEAAYPNLNLNRRRSPPRDEEEEGLANEAQDDVSGYLDEGQETLACMLAWGS
jgi:hypothetical protein